MPEHWVVNASPLIILGKVGQLDLLAKLPHEAVLPSAVIEEVVAGPEGDAARLAVQSGMFKQVPSPSPFPELAAWDLGTGETAVLAYALANQGWTAIIDDGAARKCAKSFEIPLKGTLSIILLAKKRGLIPSAAKVLRAVQEAGLYLDEHLLRTALRENTGEDW